VRTLTRIGLSITVVFASSVSWAAPLHYRPAKGYRTISTDVYEVSVRKNGPVDITLVSGELVFANVYPMVWFEGDARPKPLAISGKSTARQVANDPLGQGQGMVFAKNDCLWSIRTYIAKPYLAAQVAFVNTTRKPIKVKMLLPWCLGEPKSGTFSLGPGTDRAVILENGRTLDDGAALPALVTGASESLWNMAVYNPVTRRSLVAGFVTHTRAHTQFRLERGPEAPEDGFDLFRAQCIYDPPVEVPPDGRLVSELVYLSVGEPNPHLGLERYGAAVATVNAVRRMKPLVPHGWDSWSSPQGTDITEAGLLETLDFTDARLKRYGWTHLTVGPGWERKPGDWEPDPERFPHGMKWLADQVHARAMTAGLSVAPFVVHRDAPVARGHPDWLVGPNAVGRKHMPKGCLILDVTAPGASEYVQSLCRKVSQEWGYDALFAVELACPLLGSKRVKTPSNEFEGATDGSLTRIEALNRGLQVIRAGLGRDTCLLGGGPLPVVGVFAEGMSLGPACAPIWRGAPDEEPWGCVQALTNAARRYYFAPYLCAPDAGCAYFGHGATRARWHLDDKPELTWNQRLAWLTGTALTGGVLRIGDHFADLTEKEVAVLTRLLPTPARPARPVDLFQSDSPRIWSLPLTTPAGKWHIVALFNWDEDAARTIPLGFTSLGLDDAAYYTVYDFWQDKYYGTARWKLDVKVAPGGGAM